jgi:Tol biopolymer transport system component
MRRFVLISLILNPTGNPQDRPNDVYDGTLAYVAPTGGKREIYAMPVSGSKGRNLTNGPGQDLGATFSPDGNYIAFMSDRGGGWGIRIMEVDGSDPSVLVKVPQGFGKDWSGERLSWGP